MEEEIDLIALNHLCGEIVEGLSEGEGSDQYDLHVSLRRAGLVQERRRKQRMDPTNLNEFPNERYFLEL